MVSVSSTTLLTSRTISSISNHLNWKRTRVQLQPLQTTAPQMKAPFPLEGRNQTQPLSAALYSTHHLGSAPLSSTSLVLKFIKHLKAGVTRQVGAGRQPCWQHAPPEGTALRNGRIPSLTTCGQLPERTNNCQQHREEKPAPRALLSAAVESEA